MNRTIVIIFLIMILGGSLSAGGIERNETRGGFQLTAIRQNTYLGGHFELGIGGNLAIGGDVMIWLRGRGGMVISPDITYYFPMRVSRIDLFVGAGPSLSFGFSGGSAFRLKLQGGARYWFTSRVAGTATLISEIGDNGDVGGSIGVTWRL